ncbi:RNA polymerase II transcription factor B subunit 4 [Purpureocillium takamizusanense]|uniref:General transcription and DNA repair factor IIH subunit TFB4 n=1 Tax=Purpureocillium takamizusanense TaxID=2060973 RepID=A0A9Q8QHP8_9HYPO|nr:RNA polymerase II transcription factor B subunit 4 [Purpureocillium takamizusanense]UNI19815.1 RNA polymerase II transcription factor B subunit 4 [Purpureocillium takamizusanense]
MDAVDVSEHYEVTTTDDTPSLLSIVLDTNPRAWAALEDRLPLARAIANVLVFVNAHLAFSNVNQVAVIAAHVNRAVWLYPAPASSRGTVPAKDASGDVSMVDAPQPAAAAPSSANKYPQFAQIESTVMSSMQRLMSETTEADLAETTTQLSGALTLALCHINKAAQALSSATGGIGSDAQAAANAAPPMKGRIVVISVSDSEPAQYIPTMNAVFAASHAQVAIDTLALAGDPTFLQQACFNTDGTFLAASNPQGLLTYLMFGLVADTEARKSLITPTHDKIDFRAACFCHGKVVDTGFVCSICLSIFCELPEDAICLTCGTKLALGNYGSKPAVVPRKKKKKKRIVNGGGREETGSATGTPRP